MPEWLPSVVVTVAAIGLIVWIVHRIAPGLWEAWLTGSPLAPRPHSEVSGRRRLNLSIALVVAVAVLLCILYYVFSLPRPS